MKKIIFLVVISLAACGTHTHKTDSDLSKSGRKDSVKVVEMKKDTNLVIEKPLAFKVRICHFTGPSKVEKRDSIKAVEDSLERFDVNINVNNWADSSKVYYEVDQMPQFPGGEVELLKFIMQNLKNPSVNGEEMVQGKVICRFIVDINGSVIQPEVIRSLDRFSDAEALKVIRLLPKFIPGKQNGKNVKVWYTIPVTFKLSE